MLFLRRREPNIMKMKNMKTVIFIKELHFGRPMSISFGIPAGGGHETYGEDPTLIAILGVAYIKGLQGEGEYLRTAACQAFRSTFRPGGKTSLF